MHPDARSIPDNGDVGAQGTRAIEIARRAGITYTVHEYAHDARSSQRDGGPGYALEAVAALGIEAARVFKTIVVSVDGRLGLAIVPADAEVDLKAVADALGGRKAAIAPPAEAEKATGYVLGGISPLGTRRALPTALDDSAAAWPTIHVSAGRRGLEIELAAADLVALTRGDIADYVSALLFVYFVLIIANVVLSWVQQFRPIPYNTTLRAVLGFIEDTTNPFLNLFRSFIPRIGPLDISPIVAILALSILGGLVVSLIRG